MKQFTTSARMSKKSIISKYTHMHAPRKVCLISNRKERKERFTFSVGIHVYILEMKWKSLSCVWLFVTPWTVHGILQARILEYVAFPFPRGSSQPQGSNPGLQHCWRILHRLSHQGSPRILEWVASPFFVCYLKLSILKLSNQKHPHHCSYYL